MIVPTRRGNTARNAPAFCYVTLERRRMHPLERGKINPLKLEHTPVRFVLHRTLRVEQRTHDSNSLLGIPDWRMID